MNHFVLSVLLGGLAAAASDLQTPDMVQLCSQLGSNCKTESHSAVAAVTMDNNPNNNGQIPAVVHFVGVLFIQISINLYKYQINLNKFL